MSIAALIAWILTAAGGFVLLGKWISHGGVRSPGASRFPPGLIFSHFGLAAAGLVLWIIYLINDQDTLRVGRVCATRRGRRAGLHHARPVASQLPRTRQGDRKRCRCRARRPRDGRAASRATLPGGGRRRPRRAGRHHRRDGAARRARGRRQLSSTTQIGGISCACDPPGRGVPWCRASQCICHPVSARPALGCSTVRPSHDDSPHLPHFQRQPAPPGSSRTHSSVTIIVSAIAPPHPS